VTPLDIQDDPEMPTGSDLDTPTGSLAISVYFDRQVADALRRTLPSEGVLPMAIKLFVGGLSFSTSNDRLREAFAAAGTVESASVVTDRDTGRSRGFGFVEMATPEEAEQAISRLNGTNLDGRTIQVEKAKAPGTGGGGRGGGFGGRGGGGGYRGR
jgi:hypothetical protein